MNARKRGIRKLYNLRRADGVACVGLIYGCEMHFGSDEGYDPKHNRSRRNNDIKDSLPGHRETPALTYPKNKVPFPAESGKCAKPHAQGVIGRG